MSNPKEKAERLVEMLYNQEIHFPYIDLEGDSAVATGHMTYKSAVQCAILCVKEKIGTLTECHNFVPTSEITRQILIHEEVLTELNKM